MGRLASLENRKAETLCSRTGYESAIGAIRSIGMTDATYFFGEKLDY